MTSPPSSQGSVSSSRNPRQPVKPSPLSQQQTFGHQRRFSKDDSDLTDVPAPTASMLRSGGLKGRLRRALSLSTQSSLDTSGEDKLGSRRKVVAAKNAAESAYSNSNSTIDSSLPRTPTDGSHRDIDPSIRSTTSTKISGKSRAASLFNKKFNASTDNISLSSTVSSASVMIRKLGSIGKLARRNSLMGLFRDKDKDKHGGSDDEGRGSKKSRKASKVEATVSHATAEIDRGDGMAGLTPAAKLARQHTLRSNAEAAAARLKAQQQQQSTSQTPVPASWEKNTATRAQDSPFRSRRGASEDGRRADAPWSDDESEDHSFDMLEEEMEGEGDFEDEDVTLRLGRLTFEQEEEEAEYEPWAVGVRRSVERIRTPSRGILKYAKTYNQQDYLESPNPPFSRVRSNSTNSATQHPAEPGPLARIPSPDPDHIDGLHRSSSPHQETFVTDDESDTIGRPHAPPTGDKPGPFTYTHPNLNSSAPVLSTLLTTSNHLPRSATAPHQVKKITFAGNLSIYDTFASSVYDRRSEPATCNRLTPALAQRIKEELNSYKMEEMEVHAASRIHTHFFV
jgi:hypothetical protein